MAMNMNRRTFLKTAAAAAAAVSMTSLLGGCSPAASDTEISLYGYKVDIDMKKATKSWVGQVGAAEDEGTGYLCTQIRLTAGSGVGLNFTMGIFSAATSDGDALTLENKMNPVVLVQNVSIPVEVKISTKDKKIYDALASGKTTMYLDVAPLGSSSGTAVRYDINFATGAVAASIIQKEV